MTSQPAADENSQHVHLKVDATEEREVIMKDLTTSKTYHLNVFFPNLNGESNKKN